MRFRHFRGERFAYVTDRQPVKAGSVRIAQGGPETHAVEYLGKLPSEYITLELRASARVAEKPVEDSLKIGVAAGAASTLEVGAGRFEPREASRLQSSVHVRVLEPVAS